MGEYTNRLPDSIDSKPREFIAAQFKRDKDDVEAYVIVALMHQPDGSHSFAWETNLPDDAASGLLLTAIENHAIAMVYQQMADMVPDDLSGLDNL